MSVDVRPNLGSSGWREQHAAQRRLVEDVFTEYELSLVRFRRSACGFFKQMGQNKTYKRRPGLKVTLLAQDTDSGKYYRLVTQPQFKDDGKKRERIWSVSPDEKLTVSLLENMSDRYGKMLDMELMSLNLEIGKEPRLTKYFGATGQVNARLVCETIKKFLENPTEVIARSGEHCSYCNKPLTDPLSQSRGIGPECFRKHGDLMAWLEATREDYEESTR